MGSWDDLVTARARRGSSHLELVVDGGWPLCLAESMTEADLERTRAYWDEQADEHFHDGAYTNRAEWRGHPACVARSERLLRGTAADWLSSRLTTPVHRALGAGSGHGAFEIDLVARGVVDHVDLFDVSVRALEIAAARAASLGLTDRVAIHREDFFGATGQYDLITFMSSLHHSMDMRRTVRFAYDHLNPGGAVFADEYVGPRRFAYPREHADVVKMLYRALAPELRCEWPELPQPIPEDVAAADPTEAAQSDLIISELRAAFHSLEVVETRGTLPFILWWGLNHDALWDSPEGREFVNLLLELDDAMVISGRVPSYFAVLYATKQSC